MLNIYLKDINFLLVGIIMEYLAITPHSLKFMFQQVPEVLHNSINSKPNFSAHNAACAFDALAQYAANLVSQPWRKEFREVKVCFFYEFYNFFCGRSFGML